MVWVLLCLLLTPPAARAATYELALADCEETCGEIDLDGFCDEHCDEEDWEMDSENPVNCTLSLTDRQGDPSSVVWAGAQGTPDDGGEDKEAIKSECLSPPGSGAGSVSITETSSYTESGTVSYSATVGVEAKAKVNMWLVGETEIGVKAEFEAGTSSTTSYTEEDSRTCAEDVNECFKKLAVRSMFKRSHPVTGKMEFEKPSVTCDPSDDNCSKNGGSSTYTGYADWPTDDGTCGPYTVSMGETGELKYVKCEGCAIGCADLHEDCCQEEATEQEIQDDMDACHDAAHVWP